MAWPWLKVLDAVIGLTSVARQMNRRARAEPGTDLERRPLTGDGSGMLGAVETRLAGVMVAALKEVFDRDKERLQIERERIEADRARAERLLRIEVARQAGERVLARLRVVATTAVVGWLGTWLSVAAGVGRGPGASSVTRLILAVGWILLLGALGTSLSGQAQVHRALDDPRERPADHQALGGGAGVWSAWLLLAGLAVSSLAVLF